MFSEVVDNVVARSGRLDRRNDIIDYANATLKELQAKCLFTRDLQEDQLTITETPMIWTRPAFFRTLRAIVYTQSAFENVYPTFLMPGKQQRDRDLDNQFFYAAGNYFVFSGCSLSQTINLAWYKRFPKYRYYESGSRPAVYDTHAGTWTYLQNSSYVDTLGSDELNDAAKEIVSNWLLEDYNELVTEGTLAKIFKNVNDSRSISTFALFKSMTDDFMSLEPHDSLAYQGIT